MGAHTHVVHHGHLGNVWRLWLAGVGIVTLAGFGLYFAISHWRQGEINFSLWALGSLAGAATVYGFGYFWCLPDVLGGTSRDSSRTLWQRWSDFALLSTFIGILVIEAAYARAIWVNWSYVDLARALAILLVCPWLLTAGVVASEKYLGWTMPCGEVRQGTGWRERARGATRKWGNWLVTLLGVQRALVIGGALSLLSITLVVAGGVLGPDYKGLQIIAGSGAWPTMEAGDMSKLEFWLTQIHRGVFVLGLAVAALVLASVALGRWGRIIRGNRILATLTVVIALFEVTNIAVFIAAFGALETHKFPLGLWMLMWIIPVAIWLMRAHRGRESWDRTRLAVMVFYLPIFFLGLASLVVLTYFGAGFGSFISGMLLIWWGLVQSGREVRQELDSQEA